MSELDALVTVLGTDMADLPAEARLNKGRMRLATADTSNKDLYGTWCFRASSRDTCVQIDPTRERGSVLAGKENRGGEGWTKEFSGVLWLRLLLGEAYRR